MNTEAPFPTEVLVELKSLELSTLEDKRVNSFFSGAYQSLMKETAEGKVKVHTRREMVDLVTVDGVSRGIITRNLITGEYEKWAVMPFSFVLADMETPISFRLMP